MRMTDLAIHPLTADRWDDFEALFATDSMCRNCWCVHTRPPAAVRRELGVEGRKAYMRALVSKGPPPGVLAYHGDEPVGWLAIASRNATPDWNQGNKASAAERPEHADDPDVWAATCFFVRKDTRGLGLAEAMLQAGLERAREAGARIVEAAPMDHETKRSTAGLCVGPKRVFDRAGFRTVLERKPGRPLMRLDLSHGRRKART
jgi:GNAT superfamily N-acetyltransferase